jgi:hypothetical protein
VLRAAGETETMQENFQRRPWISAPERGIYCCSDNSVVYLFSSVIPIL